MDDFHNFMKKDFSSGEDIGWLGEGVDFIKYKLEPFFEYSLYVLGMLAIILGAIDAVAIGWRTRKEKTQDESLALSRIRLSETITLGLTFILAAEVIKTFRVPNIYQLLKVALLVLLRQMITQFLDKDVARLKKEYPNLFDTPKPVPKENYAPEDEYIPQDPIPEQYIPQDHIPEQYIQPEHSKIQDVAQETCVSCQ